MQEKNLVESQYTSLDDLEKYAEQTSSTLLYLALQAIGASDVHSDHAASHIGKAMGIATVLRATPFEIRERRLYLPAETMAKVDIFKNHEMVFNLNLWDDSIASHLKTSSDADLRRNSPTRSSKSRPRPMII